MNLKSHPIMPAPGMHEILAEAAKHKCSQEQAIMRLLKLRQEVIDAEKADPLRRGWEPPIWAVCDALLDWQWCSPARERYIRERTGLNWDEFKRAMRARLAFKRSVKMLLIMGGNRSSKSEYASKRSMEMMSEKQDANVFAMHMSNPRSIRDQQPLFWKYMPPEWQIQKATETTYIKYKQKTGFSESSFITPIGSECAFLNYMQDRDTAIEGIEPDLLAPDELIPPDWIETIAFRLATRAGIAIFTFTPVNGYTPSVKIFCDGAQPAIESPGYLLPRDGKDRDEASALGLAPEEYGELLSSKENKTAARVPASRPEDCFAWLNQNPEAAEHKSTDRQFEMVPRVLRCVDENKAVVFFHSSDNPYGNPSEVISQLRSKGAVWIRERFYGKTDKTISGMFPKFKRSVHTIAPEDIPKDGLNFLFCDPASNRNFFLTWIRLTKLNKWFVYREWPGKYHIPGHGVPGPWTIPSGKKEGLNDGARGEGQGPFGLGLLRYKFEIARLERWHDWAEWAKDASHTHRDIEDIYPGDDEVETWEESTGDGEIVAERFIDSRAASVPRIENDRPVTLQSDFQNIGLYFQLTPGSDINEGVSRINSVLDYDGDGEQTFFNAPDFYISTDCENTIYSLENWLNVDGDKGASKDPIDNLRYAHTAALEYTEPGSQETRGGMNYGRLRRRPMSGGNFMAVKGRRLPPEIRER